MMLRPEFTETLADKLLAGGCVNLISPHGQGRRRTLKDLSSILEGGLVIKQFNLREQQQDLLSLITAFLNNENQGLFILHNFELLGDQTLIPWLNKIKLVPRLSLLTVSEDESSQVLLDIEALKLPAVSKDELMAEITFRQLDGKLSAAQIASWLLQQHSPYSLLDQLQPLDLVNKCGEAGRDKRID